MSTKPTRGQARAADLLAQSLLLIAEAARLDDRSPLDRPGLAEMAARIARVSSAFDPGEILGRALESRGRSLGLRGDSADLLTLVEGDVDPLAALLLGDDEFRAAVAEAEEALGEI